jgi:hypothetical protein
LSCTPPCTGQTPCTPTSPTSWCSTGSLAWAIIGPRWPDGGPTIGWSTPWTFETTGKARGTRNTPTQRWPPTYWRTKTAPTFKRPFGWATPWAEK